MLIIFEFILIILAFLALANTSFTAGKRVFLTNSKIVLSFLKSAQVLFAECLIYLAAMIVILYACSNHFVIDFYILFLFSSMILITYHTLRMSKLPSAIS